MSQDDPASAHAALSDEQLWQAFVAGQDAALSVLCARHREALYWYLLLSTGKQDAAVQCLGNTWELLAAYRRPFEGFASFKSWLFAAATQNSVPATHPESFGLTDLVDDLKRGEQVGRRGKLFFCISDMARSERQPFLLVMLVGLSVPETAKACSFTVERTHKCLEKAFRRLARSELFSRKGASDGVQ